MIDHTVEIAAFQAGWLPIWSGTALGVVKRHADLPPFVVSWNGSLFTYFFASCSIDYRHLAADDPAAFGGEGPSVDWFENSRRAVLTHRERCIGVSRMYPTLSQNRWGLAPCAFKDHYFVHEVQPNVCGQDEWHQGVVPPYAAGSAIMFAPQESLAALREYRQLKTPDGKPLAWRDPARGGYAFVDSFSLDPPFGHEEISASMWTPCSWRSKTRAVD